MSLGFLKNSDPAVAEAIEHERQRQDRSIELIASENFVSAAVLEAQGSILTNKYAEGLPSKRYYGGCEFVDVVEQLAIDRLKQLFGADHANVQPHSGANANTAVYLATLKPGDRLLGMNLSHGGHLTHGSPVNLSGILYDVHAYGVDPQTGYLDYDQVRETALAVRPKLIMTGASAYPRQIDFAKFRQIADEVGAILVADIAHIAGLVAKGYHPTSIGQAHITTSTTHKTLRGPRGGLIMCDQDWAKAIDKAVFPGLQGGPLMHVIAAKAVGFGEALTPDFTDYIGQVVTNARVLAETLLDAEINLLTGGTDNHLVQIDLRSRGLTGKQIEKLLESAGLTANKNTVPNDPQGPMVTSGIRLGTPAVTTRGMKESEMRMIGRAIADIIHAPDDEGVRDRVRRTVSELCDAFPLEKVSRVPSLGMV